MKSRLRAPATGGRALPAEAIPCDGLRGARHEEMRIPVDGVTLEGELTLPVGATGVVLFAHESGCGRRNPRTQFVAWRLQCAGLGTLIIDLLTRREDLEEPLEPHPRFDVRRLARRLTAATVWSATHDATRHLRVGFFGAGAGAAAALIAASRLGPAVAAVVSRGGRTDLASAELARVVAPTLLVVGGGDAVELELNRKACAQLSCEKRLEIVPHAMDLCDEAGALNVVAGLATGWFRRHLAPSCVPGHRTVAQPTTEGRGPGNHESEKHEEA